MKYTINKMVVPTEVSVLAQINQTSLGLVQSSCCGGIYFFEDLYLLEVGEVKLISDFDDPFMEKLGRIRPTDSCSAFEGANKIKFELALNEVACAVKPLERVSLKFKGREIVQLDGRLLELQQNGEFLNYRKVSFVEFCGYKQEWN